jgi:hypothetical protein
MGSFDIDVAQRSLGQRVAEANAKLT